MPQGVSNNISTFVDSVEGALGIGDVCGLGVMCAMEIVKDRHTKKGTR